MKNMGCLRIQISIPDPQLAPLPGRPGQGHVLDRESDVRVQVRRGGVAIRARIKARTP